MSLNSKLKPVRPPKVRPHNEIEALKISVITAVYNREKTVGDAIESVANQNHTDLEYVVVDGMSTDNTADIIQANQKSISRSIREKDDGIYDALNKGIAAATGDVVGFLHADDMFSSDIAIKLINDKFESGDFDAVYGDLVYVDEHDTSKVTRYWRSGHFNRRRFYFGWMPPHPTVYVRKSVYQKLGNYRTDVGTAADYECLLRLMVRNEINVGYVPHVLVKMRAGGASNASIANRLNANSADRRAWLENGMKPPLGLRFTKPLSKLKQFVTKPRQT
jgi:glycosyltransferase